MICVQSVKLLHTTHNELRLARYNGIAGMPLRNSEDELVDQSVIEELVRGRCFRTVDGRELVIGWTKDVQDALGVPLEVIENLQHENSQLMHENSQLIQSRNRIMLQLFQTEHLLILAQAPVMTRIKRTINEYLELL